MQKLLKDQSIPNVAVFDTAFHSTIPPVAFNYPIPLEYRKQQMRKFGFHGTSVHYVTLEADKRLSKLMHTNACPPEHGFHLIVCHLGNGASVTAVSHGKSMDTSMGFTPLSGLMMGTRAGSIDPSIIDFACSSLDKTVDQVMVDLNKNSGLKAMTDNGDSDMRSLLEARAAGNANATLAVDMFVYRLTRHIASSIIALKGPLDAIVFTAGIGEHSAEIRRLACDQLHQSLLPQLVLDAERNAANGDDSDGVVSQEGTWPVILTIPTNEEKMIAIECLRLVGGEPSSSD
jgi:acetate kinase